LFAAGVTLAGSYFLTDALAQIYAPLRPLAIGAVLLGIGLFIVDVERRP